MDIDGAMMILNRTQHHCHYQSGPATAHCLGAEKRLENFADLFICHTDPIVGHLQHDAVSRHAAYDRFAPFIGNTVGGRNAYPSAIRHRLSGVRNQVHDHFLQMDRRSLEGRQIGGEASFDVDIRVEGNQPAMLRAVEIISDQRASLGDEGVKSFTVHGGSIGRSVSNDWVLPDTERFLSGRHASIQFQKGSFFIIDTSTNGVFVDDAQTPLGRGKYRRLRGGEKIRLGPYEIAVTVTSAEELGEKAPEDMSLEEKDALVKRAERIVLAQDFDTIKFRYYGAPKEKDIVEWLDAWPEDAEYYPRAIHVRTSGEEETDGWPDFVFELRNGGES